MFDIDHTFDGCAGGLSAVLDGRSIISGSIIERAYQRLLKQVIPDEGSFPGHDAEEDWGSDTNWGEDWDEDYYGWDEDPDDI